MADNINNIDARSRVTLGKMEVVLGAIVDAIVWTDGAGRIQWCNGSFDKLVGRHHLEDLGAPLPELLPLKKDGEVILAVNHPVNIVLKNQPRLTGIYEYERDGQEFLIEIFASGIRISEEDVSGILVIRDVTESKKAEITERQLMLQKVVADTEKQKADVLEEEVVERRKIEDQLRKLTRAVEQSPNIIQITDTNGIVEYVNPRFSTLTGFDRESVIGEKAHLFENGTITEEEYLKLLDTVMSGKEWESEYLHKRKDGGSYWEHVSVSPIRDNEDNITHFLIIMQDISVRKAAEEEMKKAVELKNEFTSTVSHELRTPLAISKEALSLLNREKVGPLTEKQKEIMKMASSNIDRLSVLINDLLDVSKLEAGKMELHKESVDVVEIVKENLEGWKLESTKRKIDLSYDIPDKEILLEIDKMRFLQVLSNLVSNALKFTPEQGTVVVTIKELDDFVEFSVKDSGVGIAKEDFSKLFQKFQQLKRTYKPGYQGTGLGLNIVKSMVNLHGGNIRVESEVDKGANFIFTLPKVDPEAKSKEVA